MTDRSKLTPAEAEFVTRHEQLHKILDDEVSKFQEISERRVRRLRRRISAVAPGITKEQMNALLNCVEDEVIRDRINAATWLEKPPYVTRGGK